MCELSVVMCTQEQLSVYLSQAVRSSCEVAQLRRAEWRRDTMYARDLWRKVRLPSSSCLSGVHQLEWLVY